jgi:hypothetical protein
MLFGIRFYSPHDRDWYQYCEYRRRYTASQLYAMLTARPS